MDKIKKFIEEQKKNAQETERLQQQIKNLIQKNIYLQGRIDQIIEDQKIISEDQNGTTNERELSSRGDHDNAGDIAG